MSTYDNIDKKYVSPYDEFLMNFDRQHPKTASQEAEAKKHQRIAQLRDHANNHQANILWEKF